MAFWYLIADLFLCRNKVEDPFSLPRDTVAYSPEEDMCMAVLIFHEMDFSSSISFYTSNYCEKLTQQLNINNTVRSEKWTPKTGQRLKCIPAVE